MNSVVSSNRTIEQQIDLKWVWFGVGPGNNIL